MYAVPTRLLCTCCRDLRVAFWTCYTRVTALDVDDLTSVDLEERRCAVHLLSFAPWDIQRAKLQVLLKCVEDPDATIRLQAVSMLLGMTRDPESYPNSPDDYCHRGGCCFDLQSKLSSELTQDEHDEIVRELAKRLTLPDDDEHV